MKVCTESEMEMETAYKKNTMLNSNQQNQRSRSGVCRWSAATTKDVILILALALLISPGMNE